MKQYYVYMMCSNNRKALYIGVTNDLIRRVYEHKHGMIDGFTTKYNTKRLVYYDVTNDVECAITREKQLKNWRREKKEVLISEMNPEWKDLYLDMV